MFETLIPIDPQVALPLIIFSLRVFNNALTTVRILLIARRQRFFSSALGFVEALVFAYVTANVIRDLGNFPNLFAYCMGLAVGSYLGMILEARYITSYVNVQIITPIKGEELAGELRRAGFGVTELEGKGHTGKVTIINSVLTRRQTPDLMNIVQRIQPNAFVTVEESRAIQHIILPRHSNLV